MVKNLPAMQETQVQSLGLEDPLVKGMATHSSILVWSILVMDRGAWQATVHGITKSQMGLSDNTFTFTLALVAPRIVPQILHAASS